MAGKSRTYINLETIRSEELYDLLDSITDEHAENSEFGGDSDAEDVLPSSSREGTSAVATPTASTSSGRPSRLLLKTKNFQTLQDQESYDYDSDDSVRDPDYEENPPKINLALAESSSEDETDIPTSTSFTYNFQRRPCVPKLYKSHNFEEDFGPTFDADWENPRSIFEHFLGGDILQQIVSESNTYAIQLGNTLDADESELRAFFAILIIMGFHQLPTARLYWSSNENFRVRKISNIMTQKRFLKILRFLHLNDNSKMPKRDSVNYDRLYKIKPLIIHLKKKFLDSYDPSRNMAVDESMVAFKGRSTMKQYMPMKPIKRGFKIWVAADSSTGYMLNFQVYEGKSTNNEEGTLGERTVLGLVAPYFEKGYCIYFDNYFTSFDLLSKLLHKKTFACGTLRENRKNYPKTVLKKDKEMSIGEYDYASSEDISVSKWKDRGKKSVVVVSTFHDPQITTTIYRTNKEGKKEAVNCPTSISDYNQNMGAVDRFDQFMSYYSIAWKTRRWWMKLFYYFLEATVVNSYICYKIMSRKSAKKPMSHLQFRSVLADQLLHNFCTRKRPGPKVVIASNKMKKPSGRSVGVDNSIRSLNVGAHLPVKGTIRRCAKCSTRAKPVRSTTICKECDVALCRDCFAPFHQNM